MRLILLLTGVICLLSIDVLSQKHTFITQQVQRVPEGKKWEIVRGKDVTIEFHPGALRSGTMCNANITSNPRSLSAIIEGEYGRPNQIYGILFKDLEKVPQANSYLYKITPISIYDRNFDKAKLQYLSPQEVGKEKVVFTAGQKVYVTGCIQSIRVYEYNLSSQELADIKREKEKEVLAIQKQKEVQEKEEKIRRAQEEQEDKKVAQEQKQQQETLLNLIKAGSNFSKDMLTNSSTISPIIKEPVLDIIYSYLQASKVKLPEHKNPSLLITFSAIFNQEGSLSRIVPYFEESLKHKSATISDDQFEKLKSNIRLSNKGIISIQGANHLVNTTLPLYLLCSENSTNQTIKVAVDRNKEIRLLEGNVTKEEITFLISEEAVKKLDKGKYQIALNDITTELIISDNRLYDLVGNSTTLKKKVRRIEFVSAQKI